MKATISSGNVVHLPVWVIAVFITLLANSFVLVFASGKLVNRIDALEYRVEQMEATIQRLIWQGRR